MPMSNSARAIIIVDNHLLVMKRIVDGNTYYTLVGGAFKDEETPDQALAREVFEETGLKITSSRHVFTEKNPAPYNSQYIFLCEVGIDAPFGIQSGTEEDVRNRLGLDVHDLAWLSKEAFHKSSFRTPQLQTAINTALKKGFPTQPIIL